MGATQSVATQGATPDQLDRVGPFELRSSQRIGIESLYEKILKRLLESNNLYDFTLVAEKDKCKSLIMYVASTLEKEFAATRFPDPDDPSSMRSVLFIPRSEYDAATRRDDAQSRKRRAVCEDIAFFMIRVVTFVAAITASMYNSPTRIRDLIRSDVERRTIADAAQVFVPDISLPAREIPGSIVDNLRTYTNSANHHVFRDHTALNEATIPEIKKENNLEELLRTIDSNIAIVDPSIKAMKKAAIEKQYWGQEYYLKAQYYYFDFGYNSDKDVVIDVRRSIVYWQREDRKNTPMFTILVGITDRQATVRSYTSYGQQPQPSYGQQQPQQQPQPPQQPQQPPQPPQPQQQPQQQQQSNARSVGAATVGTVGTVGTLGTSAFGRGGGKRYTVRRRRTVARRRKTRKQSGGTTDLGNLYTVELRLYSKNNASANPIVLYLRRDGMVTEDYQTYTQFNQKMISLFQQYEGQAEKVALVNPTERPLSGIYGTIYENFDSYQKTLKTIPEKIKSEVGAPAFYRAFLLATRQDQNRIYTLLCKNMWNNEKKFTDAVPYALLQALYKNVKGDQTTVDAELKKKIALFISEAVTEETDSEKLTGFDKISFKTMPKELNAFCKTSEITADIPVYDVKQIAVLKNAHKILRGEFDKHVEASMLLLRKAIKLEDTGKVDSAGFKDFNIRLESMFFKDAAGSLKVIEGLIAEARELIANHYLKIEKIYVDAVNVTGRLIAASSAATSTATTANAAAAAATAAAATAANAAAAVLIN